MAQGRGTSDGFPEAAAWFAELGERFNRRGSGQMSETVVLVVDDDPKNSKIVGAYLKAGGYTVEFAADGEEALEKLRDSPPELILLDVFMPAMSGLELSDALKSDPRTRGIPILAMSSYHEYAAGAPRRDLAADDFIKKPVRMDRLLEKVGNLLKSRQRA